MISNTNRSPDSARFAIICAMTCLLLTGCVSQYAGRDTDILKRRFFAVRQNATADFISQGQYSPYYRSHMHGAVTPNATSQYDTNYVHQAEFAQGIIPIAYSDMARSALGMHRYTDAIRFAKNSIEQAKLFYKDDKWTMCRLINLMENHKILYNSYLYLGDLEAAGASHKQHLMLSQIKNSKAFKEVTVNALTLRLTSMRMESN